MNRQICKHLRDGDVNYEQANLTRDVHDAARTTMNKRIKRNKIQWFGATLYIIYDEGVGRRKGQWGIR
jgi:hypothetical protein